MVSSHSAYSSEKISVVHELPDRSYRPDLAYNGKHSLRPLHDSHQDASRFVPFELQDDQLPQVVPDLDLFTPIVVDLIPYAQRQIPDDPVPVVAGLEDDYETRSYFDDGINDDDDDDKSEIDWEDEELMGRTYLSKYRRKTDGANSTSKALQLLGLERSSPSIPQSHLSRRSSSMNSSVSCLESPTSDISGPITKHAKARQLLGMKPLEQESIQEEFHSSDLDANSLIMSELPIDMDEQMPTYHDAIRALDSTADANANTHATYAAELSAEAAVPQTSFDAHGSLVQNTSLSTFLSLQSDCGPRSDISSEYSNTHSTQHGPNRLLPHASRRLSSQPRSASVADSTQNVRSLRQASQNEELERHSRQERQVQHSNSVSSRDTVDGDEAPRIPLMSRARRSTLHVKQIMARSARGSDLGRDLRGGVERQRSSPHVRSSSHPAAGTAGDMTTAPSR